MPALLISHQTIHDMDAFHEYVALAGPSIAPYGGELVSMGKVHELLEGSHDQQFVAILSFPDVEALNNWYNSYEYQAIIGKRTSIADGVVLSVVLREN